MIRHTKQATILVGLLLGVFASNRAIADEAKALRFEVTFEKSVSTAPFSGRILLLLTRQRPTLPAKSPNWFKPEPMFAMDVHDLQPGQPVVIDDRALAFPSPLSRLPVGVYWAQAVLDFGYGMSYAAAEGNGYSDPIQIDLHASPTGHRLAINHVYHEAPFKETARLKLVDIESKLLSAFDGRSVHMHAAVAFPESFEREPEKRYPVVYVIPGFGGNHFGGMYAGSTNFAGIDCIKVVLDPSCPLGHCVFADSENNGPWGQALIQELIPAIESRFHGIGKPYARFVTGHSSGGWSSLWLQVAYPDFFGGVWSTSPDPVDFRDFQRIDIYRPGENMFTDREGKPRPLARMNGHAILFYKPFSDMETVMGHGGQLGSFEAVFSPKGTDGKPAELWNRTTGAINPDVAKAWERYDIRLVLERNWPTLSPKLAGKLHVYTGAEDTFYLEGAVALLKESLHKLGSDAVIEIHPGKDHMNMLEGNLRARIAKEMAERFRKGT